MGKLQEAARVLGKEFTKVGVAFLGPCGGQDNEVPINLTPPKVDLEVIKTNGRASTDTQSPNPRRSSFWGL